MRLAGMLGTQAIADSTSSVPRFDFGYCQRDAKDFYADAYAVVADRRFYELGGHEAGLKKRDFLCFEASSAKFQPLGAALNFQNQSLAICEQKAKLKDGELIFTYKLGRPAMFSEREILNKKLAGLSLLGTVQKTDGETVNIALDIDGKKGGAAYPFHWTPETGNIMYCMPKIGTRAALMLMDCDTANAAASSSPRKNGGSCAAMEDTQKRCFITEHGKQMCLYPDEMLFSGGLEGETLQIKLNQLECMMMESTKAIQVVASLDISIEAPNVSLNALAELQTFRSAAQAQAKAALIIPKGSRLNPPTGGANDSVMVLDHQVSILAEEGVLCGMEFNYFDPYQDEPALFDHARWVLNQVLGAIVVVACVAALFLIPGLGAIATMALIGAATGAALVTNAIREQDKLDGEVRSPFVAAGQVLLGATTGAVTLASGMAMAPLGAATMGNLALFGFSSGIANRFVMATALEMNPDQKRRE